MSSDRILEIYLIGFKVGKIGLFVPAHILNSFEDQSDDRVRRFIAWLSGHRFALVAWLGRVFQSGRGYCVRLEARLDPLERVLKAMAVANRYAVFHSASPEVTSVRRLFFTRLRHQRAKHLFWVVVDLLLSIASLTIAFLPGPNVVGWYPFLRSLSHYRAFSGTRAVVRSDNIEFKYLPEISRLEENLQAPGFDRKRIHAIAEDLKVDGLEQFLERMI